MSYPPPAYGAEDEIQLTFLADLQAAQAGSDTDTFALCQNPEGCSSADPLVRMTLAQLKDYLGVVSAPPPVAFNGPDILGVMLAANCHSVAVVTQCHRKYPWGQNCVITDVIICNPNMPLSGVVFNLQSNANEPVATGTIDLPDAPVANTSGGSVQHFASPANGNVADQFVFTISTTAPAGATCDVYILGFPMQPVA